MKKILLALLALSPATSFAHVTSLASIDCLANNGVTIMGKASRSGLSAVPVETHWGLMQKNFTAYLAESANADSTIIDLESDKGLEFQIILDAKPNLTLMQKAKGTILHPSTIVGVPPVVVAFVSCDISLH